MLILTEVTHIEGGHSSTYQIVLGYLLQCSSLKCAYAFQCEGLQNNHPSLKLSECFAILHKEKLDIGCFVLNMKII